MSQWLHRLAVCVVESTTYFDETGAMRPVIPFQELGAPLSAPDDAELPPAWTPFAVNVDTQFWFGASHAILLGDNGNDGFLGSGQIVQITDADGDTHPLYDFVPSQVLIDSEPTSWVEQG